VDADDVAVGDGKEAGRVVLAEVALDHEWQTAKVVERLQGVGFNSSGIKTLLVKRNAVVRPLNAPSQAFHLKLAELRAGHRLDVAIPDHVDSAFK
jgi:hypothetical protein